MRFLTMIVVCILALSACARPGSNYTSYNQSRRLGVLFENAPSFPDQATVVLGIAPGSLNGVRIEIEHMEGPGSEQLDKRPWEAAGTCNPEYGRCTISTQKTDDFAVFRMPPGTYAISQVASASNFHLMMGARKVYKVTTTTTNRYSSSSYVSGYKLTDPIMSPDTPRFTVKAGEVVYVGTIAFSGKADGTVTSHRTLDEEGARKTLSDIGETRAMITRPWERPAGPLARPAKKIPTS